MVVDGKPVNLGIWDMSYLKMLKLSVNPFPGADVFILCFSLTKRETRLSLLHNCSFTDFFSHYHASYLCTLKYETVEHVSSVWYPKCRRDVPSAPIILVGTIDPYRCLKDDENENEETIPLEEIQAKAKEIGAYEYIECDIRPRTGVEQVFFSAARAGLRLPPKRLDTQTANRGCSLQ